MEAQSFRQIRFGSFEVDLDAREMRKNGVKVKLQDQPFQVLALLVERQGEIVTREELQKRLWPADTFVDFDRSLNTAVNKLRETLDDSASQPRYVETLARRGYRFVAPVEPLAAATPVTPAVPTRRRRPGRRLVVTLALVPCLAILAILFSFWPRTPDVQVPLRKFSYTVPGNLSFSPAISPDGRQIAYLTGDEAEATLWIQQFDRERPRGFGRMLSGYPITSLFWSPGSDVVAFNSYGRLMRTSVQESTRAITSIVSHGFWGATWSRDGASIVFSGGTPARLYEVSAQGGAPKPLLPAKDSDDVQFLYPHFLPPESGGRTLVLAVARGEGQSELAVVRLETGRWQTLGPGARPVYSRTGHILYEYNPPGGPPSVWAIPFSLKTRQAIGQSFAVAENAIRASVAEDGTLVYLSNPPTTETRLVWRDRNGRYVGRLEQTQSGLSEPALSPDGRFVAVSAKESRIRAYSRPFSDAHIWVHDIARGVKTRLTSFPGDNSRPIWSPDGREIVFSREHRDMFLMSADGSAKEKVLLDSPGRESIEDWSADGNYIVYTVRDPRTDFDLWYLQRSGKSGGYKAKPFSQAPFQERGGRVSPDSRFLAYCTDESGGWEVYVQRFPEGGSRVQVSGHGGSQPRWRRDGKELFYVEGDSLIAVGVTSRPDFKVQATRRLFRHANLRHGVPFARYDVSPAGDRFLLIEPAEAAPSQTIHVVQNWFAEFRRKQ